MTKRNVIIDGKKYIITDLTDRLSYITEVDRHPTENIPYLRHRMLKVGCALVEGRKGLRGSVVTRCKQIA